MRLWRKNTGEYLVKYTLFDSALYVRGPAKVYIWSGACSINFRECRESDFLVIPQSRSVDLIPTPRCEVEVEEGYKKEVEHPHYTKELPDIVESLKKAQKIMVVGNADSGKTTKILQIANILFDQNKKVGIVDADIGQSDIGTPTTISYGVLDSKKIFMHEISEKKSYFIGSTNPKKHLLEMVLGTKKMVDFALSDGCDYVLIDTTSLNTEKKGRMLKRAKIELIEPDIIVAIQKENEISHLLSAYKNVVNIKTYENIGTKSNDERFLLRDLIWKKYFESTKEHTISIKDVKFLNSLFKSGRRLSISERQFLSEMIGTKVVYAEHIPEGYYVVVDGSPTKTYYEIYAIHKNKFEEGLLIGLLDNNFEYIDIAIVKEIDFKRDTMVIISTRDSIDSVAFIMVGDIRLSPKGDEIGKVKAGTI